MPVADFATFTLLYSSCGAKWLRLALCRTCILLVGKHIEERCDFFPPILCCKSLELASASFSIAISLPAQEVCQALLMRNTCSARAGL